MSPALGAPISVASERLPGFPASFFAAMLLGLRPRVAIAVLGSNAAHGPDLLERAAALERGLLAGERLPAHDRDIDVGRAELDRVAGAARHLGRDDRRARAAERLVDGLPRRAVVLDRRRRMHSTGFCVPWTVSVSCPRLGICHSVVCLRSPAQCPWPRTAYQQRSCCQW